MQGRAAQAQIYNARCVRTSHLVNGDKTARRVLSLVILTCISSTNTPFNKYVSTATQSFTINDQQATKTVFEVILHSPSMLGYFRAILQSRYSVHAMQCRQVHFQALLVLWSTRTWCYDGLGQIMRRPQTSLYNTPVTKKNRAFNSVYNTGQQDMTS